MANLTSLFFVLFFCLLGLTLPPVLATKEYKAAAFEHEPYFVHDGSIPSRQKALRIMQTNTGVYREKVHAARQQGAQIIVFPEDGIYGPGYSRDEIQHFLEPIPDVSKSSKPLIPCTDPRKLPNTEILQELSCMALNNSIALVANMGDIKYCTETDPNCPPDGRYQFNTDVVFDTDGRLLAKYHKQHLFHEKQFNTPVHCEFVTFVTSFKVRFGVFTCFDLLFKSPAIDLVRKYGVRNIVFPTAWFDGFPMLNAVQFQQAWSRSTCVNFIAANLNLPIINFTGSGIYTCGEFKTYTYGTDPSKKRLLIATLTDLEESDKNSLWWKPRYSATIVKRDKIRCKSKEVHISRTRKTFTARVLHDLYTLTKLVAPEDELSVCGSNMCCNLSYKIQSNQNDLTESFALGAFSGNHNPEGYFLEVCVLLKCLSSEDESCGEAVEESHTVFQSFRLSGNFSSKATVFPGVLSSGVKLSQPDVVKFKDDEISSENFGKPLLTAALVGRVYSRDKPEL